jgi:hypothetical protein
LPEGGENELERPPVFPAKDPAGLRRRFQEISGFAHWPPGTVCQDRSEFIGANSMPGQTEEITCRDLWKMKNLAGMAGN